MIENACAACNVISEAWCQKNNAEAMDDLIKNHGVTAQPLPEPVVDALRESTSKILAEAIAKDPVTKKVHDSYMAYMEKFTSACFLPHTELSRFPSVARRLGERGLRSERPHPVRNN